MSLPRLAIVGRPNVGKSSLLNMLAKAKVSIVDPTPGVTRDRVAAVVELEGSDGGIKLAEVIDTGGYGVYTADGARYDDIGADLTQLSGPIEDQIAEAVRAADLILFVVDAQAGVTALDLTVARLLRERAMARAKEHPGTPILVVANKTDADSWEPHAMEFASLGFGEPAMVSALNNHRRRIFFEQLYDALPERAEGPEGDRESEPEMRLAIIGKRNAGKSTFVNALAGEERVIVSEIAGTTRDSVDVRFEMEGKSFIAVDTAGFRKRKSMADQVEWYAAHRALRSVRRADVVLLLLDATEKVSQVDKQLTKEIQDNFKPCVIVVNKWDLAQGRNTPKGTPVSTEDYRKYLEKELKGLSKSPIVFATAAKGEGVREAVEIAEELFRQATSRVSTGKLNTIMREILEHRGPSSKLGTKVKVLYTTQVATAPPTIVLVVNKSQLFSPEYERYMLNRLSERTPFEEVPIRLIIRDRKRARIEDLLSGRRGEEEEGEVRKDRGDERLRPPKMPRMVHGLADEIPEEEEDAQIAKMLEELDEEEG